MTPDEFAARISAWYRGSDFKAMRVDILMQMPYGEGVEWAVKVRHDTLPPVEGPGGLRTLAPGSEAYQRVIASGGDPEAVLAEALDALDSMRHGVVFTPAERFDRVTGGAPAQTPTRTMPDGPDC